jgi:ribosomal protein L35
MKKAKKIKTKKRNAAKRAANAENKPRIRKAAKDRFNITGTGMVLRRAQGGRHRFFHTSDTQRRRRKRMYVVEGEFAKKIKQMLGVA